MKNQIHIGYQVGTGEPASIPLHHTVITGVTQLSGKTTTLEALIQRSNLRAVAFRTKRGESGFTKARVIPPFFRERSDWLFVEALLEAAMREKMKFERGSIIRVCKDAGSLEGVHRNVQELLPKARGINQEILQRLDAYFELILPELDKVNFSRKLSLDKGVNVIDLVGLREEIQSLVVGSVIQEVHDNHTGVIIVVPEANEFIPQGRGSPAKLPALRLIRKGAAVGNYLWMDSQDIAGVEKDHLKQVGVWILGVQTEQNEVERTLKHIPDLPKPNATQLRTLSIGQFYACFAGKVSHIYVQPYWMPAEEARRVAMAGAEFSDRPADEARKRFAPEISRPPIVVGGALQERPVHKEPEDLSHRVEIEALNTELNELQEKLRSSETLRLDALRRLTAVKKYLQPQFEAMTALFSEIGDDAQTGSVDKALWDPWLTKAGIVGCKKTLEILLDRRRLKQQQLATLAGVGWRTFRNYRAWLTKNNLVKLDGDDIELLPL